MDTDLEKLLHEAMDKKIADAKGFFSTTKRKVIGAVVAVVLVVGIVFASHWYSTGKAAALVDDLKRKFDEANQSRQEEIFRNQIRIDELEKTTRKLKADAAASRAQSQKGVADAIKTRDPKTIAGKFDNVIDGYVPPSGWGR